MKDFVSTYALSTTSFVCSIFSVLGSICVISSYAIAKTKSNPKAAQLIVNLALADLFWFVSSLALSGYWVAKKLVPPLVCMVCSPILAFSRTASLVWTCAVSFDVYMSVNRRKWLWKNEQSQWEIYRRRYIVAVLVLSCPLPLYTMVNQQNDSGLGCRVGYEKIGSWAEFFFPELFPILIGYIFILVVVVLVRNRMSLKNFPRSVRKRRRKIMYYYVLAAFVCWTPVIIFYICELFVAFNMLNPEEPWMETLELVARATHYLTGFFNFVIFGMSDPHLKRSFYLVLYSLGLSCCLSPAVAVSHSTGKVALMTSDIEKSVMFDGPIATSAELNRNKRETQRHIKLSMEDKLQLYKDRPDLDSRTRKSLLAKSSPQQISINQDKDMVLSPSPVGLPLDNQLRQRDDDDDEDDDGKDGARKNRNTNSPLRIHSSTGRDRTTRFHESMSDGTEGGRLADACMSRPLRGADRQTISVNNQDDESKEIMTCEIFRHEHSILGSSIGHAQQLLGFQAADVNTANSDSHSETSVVGLKRGGGRDAQPDSYDCNWHDRIHVDDSEAGGIDLDLARPLLQESRALSSLSALSATAAPVYVDVSHTVPSPAKDNPSNVVSVLHGSVGERGSVNGGRAQVLSDSSVNDVENVEDHDSSSSDEEDEEDFELKSPI